MSTPGSGLHTSELNHAVSFTCWLCVCVCVAICIPDGMMKKMLDLDESAMSRFVNELLVLVGLIKVRWNPVQNAVESVC